MLRKEVKQPREGGNRWEGVEVAAVLNGDQEGLLGDNTQAGGYPDNGVSAGRVAQADYQIITQMPTECQVLTRMIPLNTHDNPLITTVPGVQ